MGKALTSQKPRLTNLSKKLGAVGISNLTKQCAAFLLLYIYFILLHQLIGFKVQLWLSLCLMAAVAGCVINCRFSSKFKLPLNKGFTKRHHKEGACQAKPNIYGPNATITSTKRSTFWTKEASLMDSLSFIYEKGSHCGSSMEHEEKARPFKSLLDRIHVTSKSPH